MADENTLSPNSDQTSENILDPLPAYSPPASIASTEASLWTLEPDFAPEFTNDSQDGGFSVKSHTSAFIQAFVRPNMHPRLVSVGLDDQVPQEHGRYGQRTLEELKGVSLDIVVMVVGENVDPFIAIGQRLLEQSHRVRIAAHIFCEALVRSRGLDFFAVSHDHIHPMGRCSLSNETLALQYLPQLLESMHYTLRERPPTILA
ncbi:hypothetical protein BDV29DRAFT_152588 [Aspergillus leporis]|uniref:Uncharacterized protein n=1 Tax=Aspergillus leporis TaxID=41062 RepID=A0A5N5XDD6_9EURO|nr:hypothetical protein BDV29DRAFT_152588 [Aspergillus leporis]